jgi:uncharacterized protein (TIGR03083 family)
MVAAMTSSFRVLALDHCALIAADSAGLADAAEGNLDARVEFCPGWSVADLVRHVWDVHAFWGQLVERRLADPDDYVAPPEPSDDELIEAFRAGATRLVETLRAADPATPVWTWARQHDAGFVIRHQVQEAAVHRWDAEHAAGRSFTIDRDGAVDAVDEFLSVSLSPKPKTALAGPVALVATDAEVAWTVRPGAGGVLTPAAGIDDDATQLRATAADLLLWLYRRRPAGPVEVIGDAALPPVLSEYAGTD